MSDGLTPTTGGEPPKVPGQAPDADPAPSGSAQPTPGFAAPSGAPAPSGAAAVPGESGGHGYPPPAGYPAGAGYPPPPSYPGAPGYQPASPGYTYPMGYAAEPPHRAGTNGFAIASFILGLLGFSLILAILSIVFGITALTRIRREPQRGRGLAITGIVLSGVWMVLTVVAVVLLAVFGAYAKTPGPAGAAHPGQVNVFSLKVGQCFQNPANVAKVGVTNVSIVPCTSRHNAQVFAEFDLSGSDLHYPGGDAIRADASRGCEPLVAKTLDPAKVTRAMSVHFLFPLPLLWLQGHRTVTCLVMDSSAGMTSSVLRAGAGG